MKIYFPVTCDLITPGHIKCLEALSKQGEVTVGLLTDEALQEYKNNIVPFEDRFYILRTIAKALDNIRVIPQDNLDPSENLDGMDAIASGDGFEPIEEEAIKKYGLLRIHLRLPDEQGKRYSSSSIKAKLRNEHFEP